MPDLPRDAVLAAPADLAAAVAAALGRAGVPVGPERAGRFAAALRLVPPATRSALRATAGATLVGRAEHLPELDAVLAGVLDAPVDPATRRGDPTVPPLPRGGAPSQPAPPPPDGGRRSRPGTAGPATGAQPAAPSRRSPPEQGRDGAQLLAAASPRERLRRTSFADLSATELEQVLDAARRLVLSPPPRRTRRTRAARRGDRLDLRRTVRAALRSAGEPLRPRRRRRRARARRLVLLCDTSASMAPYTAVHLALAHGAVLSGGAEAFVFATRLTRVTRALRARGLEPALEAVAAAAPDAAGGTRLAEALRRFVDGPGRRGAARGAVVVVLSDGWSTDEPAEVAAAMERLRRLAARVVWVNPRKAAPGYLPLVGGMAAALPSCDAFVEGHSLAALEAAAAAVAAPLRGPAGSRRPLPARPAAPRAHDREQQHQQQQPSHHVRRTP